MHMEKYSNKLSPELLSLSVTLSHQRNKHILMMNFYKISRRGFSRTYTKRDYERELSIPRLISEESLAAFNNAWPNILDETLSRSLMPDEVKERLRRLTDYFLTGGSKFRPFLALLAFDVLEKEKSPQKLHKIRVLAWGSEMLHAHFSILGDIQDGTKLRHGKPCWHTLPDTGRQATNDASLLKCLIFLILKDNFGKKKTYVNLKPMFDNAIFHTGIGHRLDRITSEKHKKYLNFTMDHYNKVIDYKTTHNMFKFPIFLAMWLADKTEEKLYLRVGNVCTDIGKFFQMQMDYDDCFREDYGSTIPGGRYSWFAVSALQRCTPAQRIVFTSCYGSHEPAHIERIQQLFVKLQLPQLYLEEKKKIKDEIIRKANALKTETVLKSDLFHVLFEAMEID